MEIFNYVGFMFTKIITCYNETKNIYLYDK